jgi:hypothetical protein
MLRASSVGPSGFQGDVGPVGPEGDTGAEGNVGLHGPQGTLRLADIETVPSINDLPFSVQASTFAQDTLSQRHQANDIRQILEIS